MTNLTKNEVKEMKIGRNDPCPCGSGKKYKKCCMNKEGVEFSADLSPLKNINHLMQKGYEFTQAGLKTDACNEWWTAWKETLAWLGSRNVTSIEKLDDLAGNEVAQSFRNWVQDFEMALENINEFRYQQMRYDFTTEFRSRFPESSPLIMLNMGTAGAEALFHLGRREDGDANFEKVVNEHPKNPWALIRWGDMYTTWMNKENADHARARELYERALKVAENPTDREDAELRIKDLES